MTWTRRQFLTGFTKAISDKAVNTARRASSALLDESCNTTSVSPNSGAATTQRTWLRPPGAVAENAFLRKCTRCTDCLNACPYDAIRRLGPEFGDSISGTPAVIPHETPCYLCHDMPCISACNEGALLPTTRSNVRMGSAVIDHQHCYQTLHQPCDYCVLRCPLKGDAISWDENRLPRIDREQCAGCGVCSYLCPADAIIIQDPGQ